MQTNFIAEVSLGYFQSSNTAFNTAALLSSITGLAAVMAKGPVLLLIQPEAQAVRWTDDGTMPTAAIGYNLAAGAELRYTSRNYANLRFFSVAAGAIINVVVYSHNKEFGG